MNHQGAIEVRSRSRKKTDLGTGQGGARVRSAKFWPRKSTVLALEAHVAETARRSRGRHTRHEGQRGLRSELTNVIVLSNRFFLPPARGNHKIPLHYRPLRRFLPLLCDTFCVYARRIGISAGWGKQELYIRCNFLLVIRVGSFIKGKLRFL